MCRALLGQSPRGGGTLAQPLARRRYIPGLDLLANLRVQPGVALRAAMVGYTLGRFKADLIAGLVVAVVALPLNIALAIALGVRPEAGLYSAIVAGVVASLSGGSKFQVTGPTAVLVVILTPVAVQYGLAGLAIATLGAGLILVVMGTLRLGRLIEFIPFPVTTAFTVGIGLTIATLQVKDFFGLHELLPTMPLAYTGRVMALAGALESKFGDVVSVAMFDDLAIGLLTLLILVLWPRTGSKVPGPLVALPAAAIAAFLAHRYVPGFAVDTIASRFASPAAPHGMPSSFPPLVWPWHEAGPIVGGVEQGVVWDRHAVGVMLSTSFGIAMLGAIATLLSAVVADGLTGRRHDPNAELVGQGLANIVTPFFGGFAVTGAIARTLTGVRSGATSPLACVAQCAVLLCALLVLTPLLGTLPMAAMAGLLLHVSRGMLQPKSLLFLLRYAPWRDAMVLLICLLLTVFVDMATAVSVGVVLAAVLFMQRMAEVARVQLVGGEHPAFAQPVPRGVVLYDIGGPLFFGAAGRAMEALREVNSGVRAVILDMTDVPQIDATGMVSLDSVVTRLGSQKVLVVLAGVQPDPMHALKRASWLERDGMLVAGSVEAAVEICRAALNE